jgi:HTH-type transcriptional regulator/antitoxin MqsA
MFMTNTQCVSCGANENIAFTNRTFHLTHKTLSRDVHGINGDECPLCKEIVFCPSDDSANRYSKALDSLVHKHRGQELFRIRAKLNLTQAQMVSLFAGGGHNAVSRYENGETAIPKPLWVLIRLLDRKPELLKELISH